MISYFWTYCCVKTYLTSSVVVHIIHSQFLHVGKLFNFEWTIFRTKPFRLFNFFQNIKNSLYGILIKIHYNKTSKWLRNIFRKTSKFNSFFISSIFSNSESHSVIYHVLFISCSCGFDGQDIFMCYINFIPWAVRQKYLLYSFYIFWNNF